MTSVTESSPTLTSPYLVRRTPPRAQFDELAREIRILKKQLQIIFAKLRSGGFRLTSKRTVQYNCIAWAAGDSSRWWWPRPGGYWPPGATRTETLKAFEQVYAAVGLYRLRF